MAKPKRMIRPVSKTLSLPEDLVTKVDLELFSELEGKIPHGAWAAYVSDLIREDFKRKEKLRDERLYKQLSVKKNLDEVDLK